MADWRELLALADKSVPGFRRAFLEAVALAKTNANLSTLRTHLSQRRYSQAADYVDRAFTAAVGGTYRKTLAAETFRLLGQAGTLSAQAVGGGGTFSAINPAAVRWAQTASATRVTAIADEARQAIREVVARGVNGALPPAAQARIIRDSIGLLPRQAQALSNYEKTLTGLSAERAAVLRARYAKRLLTQRATTIARTETIAATQAGLVQAWVQLQDEGKISRDMEKRWIVTPDDRLCPICKPLSGQRAPLPSGFFQTPTGAIERPPAHPNCRCSLALVPTRKRGRPTPPPPPKPRVIRPPRPPKPLPPVRPLPPPRRPVTPPPSVTPPPPPPPKPGLPVRSPGEVRLQVQLAAANARKAESTAWSQLQSARFQVNRTVSGSEEWRLANEEVARRKAIFEAAEREVREAQWRVMFEGRELSQPEQFFGRMFPGGKRVRLSKDMETVVREANRFLAMALPPQLRLLAKTDVYFERMSFRAIYRSQRRFGASQKPGMHVRKAGSWDVYVHEFGHHIEYEHPLIAAKVKEFFTRRTAGQSKQRYRPDLARATAGEFVIPDRFMDEYIGKVYPHGATEVLSMGLQQLYKDASELSRKDPEMFDLMMEILGVVPGFGWVVAP